MFSRAVRVLLLVVACTVGLSPLAPAQANPAPADPLGDQDAVQQLTELSLEELMAVEVATVTTASRRKESFLEAPGTVIVIDRRQIERRGYVTLIDVLNDLPGVDLTPYFFSEIGTQVAIRGIKGNNKIVVLVNGVRINPPGGEYVPLRTDLSVRDAEQIEIVYGPGSTLYGRDAIAAVINIITRQPDAAQGEVSVAGGPDNTRQAWGTVSGAFGRDREQRVFGHVYYFSSDLTDLDRAYPKWWAPYAEVANPKGSGNPPYRTDQGLQALVRVESGDSALQVVQRLSERSSSEGFSTILGYVPEAHWEDSSLIADGRNMMTITDRVRLESALTYSRYEIDPSSRYVFPAGDSAWFYDDYKYGLGSGAGLSETLWIDISPTLNVLVGGEAFTYQITPKSTVPGRADPSRDISSQAGDFVYFTERGNPATRQEIPRAVTLDYETYAAYTEAAWQFLPTWKTIAGARISDDTRLTDDSFSPRFALIHNIGAHITVKYTYTRAFVSPAAYFSNAPYDNGTILNTSNPEVDSEKAEMHELHGSYVDDHLNLGISVYQGCQENLFLIADSALPQTVLLDQVFLEDGSTRTLGNTVNGGESQNRGVDLFGEFQWRGLSPWFSYSYVEGDDDTAGMPSGLPGLSAHLYRLGTTWAISERLWITPSLVARSEPENIHGGVLEDELRHPWQVDLHAQYRLNQNADVFAKVYNVTDHKYALGGISGNAVPQETIHGLAGVKVHF